MKEAIELKGLCKKFAEQKELRFPDMCFLPGKSYALMGESGSGKTTLLRLLMGLETPEEGEIRGTAGKRFSAVFQEDRLCDGISAEENVRLCLDRRERHEVDVRAELLSVLPEEALGKPCRLLSGGQRRRVALVRAMAVPSAEIILLDEPFTGLDSGTKERAIQYVLAKKRDRLLLISTHDRGEAEGLLAGEQELLFLD